MKFSITRVLILTSILTVHSQQEIRICGSDEHLDYVKKSRKHDYSVLYEDHNSRNFSARTEETGVITIPVVVHVVYNSSVTNISDEQIFSQIEVLNRDFRAKNNDTSKVPSVFKSLVADVGIEFCLAKRDPFGNPTNGITRTSTTKQFFNVNTDDAKFSSTGGKDIWDRNKYLNIWVVPDLKSNSTGTGGSTLGYAEYPGGDSKIDGVVVIHRAFGTIGSALPPFNLGRTTTHEIGHWLGLFHTFENGCVGTSNATCGVLGDRVCDTPPASEPTYGCPSSTKNTCTESPADRIDMTMNFMDYVNDFCMYFFTTGQKNRMLNFINNSRSSLKTSNGCQEPELPTLNATLIEVIEKNRNCTSPKSFILSVLNTGKENITSLEIKRYENDVHVGTQSFSTNIATNESELLLIDNFELSQKGEITVKFEISKVNMNVDNNSLDNFGSLIVKNVSSKTLPYIENFENENDLRDWIIKNPDNSFTWERIRTSSLGGSYAFYVNNFDYSNGNGQYDDLYSPIVKIGSNSSLTFDYAYKLYTPLTENILYSDTLIILYSENCSTSLVELNRYSALSLTTGEPYYLEDPYFPATEDWKTKKISLNQLEGKDVRLVFRNVSDHENNLFIDNVTVSETTNFMDVTNSRNLQLHQKEGYLYWKSDFIIEEVTIRDITGKNTLSKKSNGADRIVVQNLPSGIYIVELKGQKELTHKKIFLH